jgi:TonB family protein
VLCHELLHVQRRDWVWLLAEEAVRATLWFHPAVWWLVSRVQRSREELVDAITVGLTGSRRAYLEALLTFGDGGRLTPAPAFGHRHHLARRMTLIATEGHMSTTRTLLTSLTVALVVLFATSYSARAFPLVQANPANSGTPTDAQPDWAKGVIRLGDKLPMPKVVKKVNAVYPEEAKAAKVEGDVQVEVRIDADGRIRNARVTKSVPMLDQAALDAVKQWEFQPPLLNGKPVPVLADINIRFTLK